jgi:hypothetical protein
MCSPLILGCLQSRQIHGFFVCNPTIYLLELPNFWGCLFQNLQTFLRHKPNFEKKTKN